MIIELTSRTESFVRLDFSPSENLRNCSCSEPIAFDLLARSKLLEKRFVFAWNIWCS